MSSSSRSACGRGTNSRVRPTLDVHPRGGVLIDAGCQTSDPRILAIGEVANFDGLCVGLVAPGYAMAEVAATRLLGGEASFPGYDLSTKLKLSGVDVASFGDAFATTPGALDVVYADPVAGVYKKLVLSDDAKTLLGGILVGDASAYGSLRPLVGGALGGDPAAYLMPEGGVAPPTGELPDEALVCSCNSVTAGTIRHAVHEEGCTDVAGVKACTKAGAACGSCVMMVKKIVGTELAKSGAALSNALCEHFDMSRRQLFDAVRVSGLTTFSAVIERFGIGRGCDICKPALASILSTLVGSARARGRERDAAGHQRPRDGEPAEGRQLLGRPAYPRRRDHPRRAARRSGRSRRTSGCTRRSPAGSASTCSAPASSSCPTSGSGLVEAGFESGHAYGKSLRTVKSCVGSTWCRYGVQDSVGMAVELELRYRGLRSPHKLKLGVSGCARECAEARGKDVGVIATEAGWNMYVGGNGGFTPRHAVLLAEGLSDAELLTAIDRFLMYYIFTADRLQRTAPWFEDLEGGIEGLRAVIFDDSLGICADLDAAMPDAHRLVRGRVEGDARGSREAPPVRLVRQRPDHAGPVAGVHRRARSGPAGHRVRARRRRRAHRRNHPGGAPMTMVEPAIAEHAPTGWVRVCALTDLEVERGRAALLGGIQIALFLTAQRTGPCGVELRPLQPRERHLARHRRHPAGCSDRRLADVQAGLRSAHRRLPRHPGQGADRAPRLARGRERRGCARARARRRTGFGGVRMTTMLGISLAGRTVVMVGGGAVTARRLERFLADGARVTIVAPELSVRCATLVDAGEVTLGAASRAARRRRRCVARAHGDRRPACRR